MRVTPRDGQVVRTVYESGAETRDQILREWFSSVSRCNYRLVRLCRIGLLKPIDTPFLGQKIYIAGPEAAGFLGLPERFKDSYSPRFLQHCLSVNNVRLKMRADGADGWLFERHLWHRFSYGGKEWQIRPDGASYTGAKVVAVEVDLGTQSLAKFRHKLLSFQAFVRSGQCQKVWQVPSFALLAVTTGSRRQASLFSLMPKGAPFELFVKVSDQHGNPLVRGWS